MSEIWAILVAIALSLIVYGLVSSARSDRRRRAAQQATLPVVPLAFDHERAYHVALSDGRRLQQVRLLGASDPTLADGLFWGWGAAVVLQQASGQKIYIRAQAIRSIEEA